MESRRSFLGKVALGAAAMAAPPAAAAGGLAAALDPDSPPARLLTPFQPGDPIGLGWWLQRIQPPRRGALPLHLAHPAHGTVELLVCARGERPVGLAATRHFDLVLLDGGRGDRPTVESLARAVRVLAHAIAANERDPLPPLEPHPVRLARYGPDPA